jgi:Fe-S-cluster-containing dehydrogenase component
MEACPWGVPRFNFYVGTIGKCDLCWERVAKGEKPFCVSACPNAALEIKETKGEGS